MAIRFTGIATTITRLRPGDIYAVDSVANGSAQVLAANMGACADFGIFAFNNATQVLWSIPFSTTLASAPMSFDFSFLAPTGNVIVPSGMAILTGSTTSFGFQLSGPLGDTVHSLKWKAYF